MSPGLRIVISEKHALLDVAAPLMDARQLKPRGQPQRVLTDRELLQVLQRDYTEQLLSKLTEIKITRMAMEYVPLSNDVPIVTQYTLCPA